MISLLNISSKSSSIKRKAIKRNKKISWKNKTSGASYSVPRKIILQDLATRINRPSTVKATWTNRYLIRPSSDVFCYRESKMRQELGDSLYVLRGEYIRELTILYKASRKVCFMASVNMLKHWISCYRVADTKRFLANHI